MRTNPSLLVLAIGAALLAACAPSPRQGGQEGQAGQRPESPAHTLVMVTRIEPKVVAPGVNIAGATNTAAKRLLTAGLSHRDDRGVPRPHLAQSLPQLGADSWRVLADGRMETTFILRPGLTWHDGTPLVAEDFAFGHRVHMAPSLGLFAPTAEDKLKEEVLAPDPRTVVVRWRSTFAEADSTGVNALPRHLLEASFEAALRGATDTFASLPYWTREYVGLGPYRLDRWEPGAFIEGVAFEGHALGRPRIDRVKLMWISDPNAVLANLLSGDAHIAVDDAMRFQVATALKREWAPRGAGTVIFSPTELRYIQVQQNQEFVNPRSLLDVRVRKALVHSVDKQALNDGLLEGEGLPADSLISPLMEYYPAVDRAIVKYPYDLRRVEQLLGEASYTKRSDGSFANAAGEVFGFEHRATAGGQEEAEMAILVDGWRRAGLDARNHSIPPALAQDGETRSTFPATAATITRIEEDTAIGKLLSDKIPRRDNRWVGSNRGGWSHPEYDRLYTVFTSSLDRAARNDAVVQMMRIATEGVGAIPLYFNFDVDAHVAALQGPRPRAPQSESAYSNIHEWIWQ